MSHDTLYPRTPEEDALSRIRAAMEKHGEGPWIDTPHGLAASVDTFIETHVNLPKVQRWYTEKMTRLSHALGIPDEMPYYCNDVAIERLVAEIERLRRVEQAARSEITYMDETKAAHPDALVEPTLAELRAAIGVGAR